MKAIRYILWIQITATAVCVLYGQKVRFSHHSDPINIETHGAGKDTRKKGRPCGDRLCICQGIRANCSRIPGGLQYLPPLPEHIRYVYFSYNQLLTLPADFFRSAPQLYKVDLRHNNLTYISPEAFDPLVNLKYLFLSANPGLNYTTLAPAFSVATLQELDIMSCSLGPLPAHLFRNTSLHQLSILRLHDNDVGDVSLSVFKPLRALAELDLASNSMPHFHVDCVMPSLTNINLDSNNLYIFPTTCAKNGSSLLPRLRLLKLQDNSLSVIPPTLCLPRVQVVTLGENKISKIEAHSFNKLKFPSLVQVSLVTMHRLIFHIGENAFSNPTLEIIDLAFNNIAFNFNNISDHSFAGCPRLYNLDLRSNRMEVDEDRFVTLFGHLSTVSQVDMQNSRLSHLSSRMLSGFRNLTCLQLSRNLIPGLSGGLFDSLTHLRNVDLSQNQIRVVPPAAFPAAVRDRLQSLDLSGNPFSCSCGLLWFRAWLVSNDSLFRNSFKHYTCENIPGKSIRQFYLADQACLLSDNTYTMIVVSCSLIILTLTVVTVFTQNRWHLRLLCYDAFRPHGDFRRRLLEHGAFQYDVFVCYDSFDDPWVRRHLVLGLEERLGLRLCLQDRDLDPSLPELQTICDGVESSKRVLMLFSANFAQSPLCQFQLAMCLTHVLERGDALIIACLDDLPSRAMTSSMMGVLNTTTCIQWADHRDAMAAFWGRLDIALQDLVQRHPQP